MRLRILDSALEDIDRGRVFYDRQGEGLGAYSSQKSSRAGIHRKVFGFHRLLARRFPYGVYYQIEEGGTVVVWRVLDLRRSPSVIQKALE